MNKLTCATCNYSMGIRPVTCPSSRYEYSCELEFDGWGKSIPCKFTDEELKSHIEKYELKLKEINEFINTDLGWVELKEKFMEKV